MWIYWNYYTTGEANGKLQYKSRVIAFGKIPDANLLYAPMCSRRIVKSGEKGSERGQPNAIALQYKSPTLAA
jgi:hypothetical protein